MKDLKFSVVRSIGEHQLSDLRRSFFKPSTPLYGNLSWLMKYYYNNFKKISNVIHLESC